MRDDALETWATDRAQRIRQLALELQFEMQGAMIEGDIEAKRLCDEAYLAMRMSLMPFGQPREPSPDEVIGRMIGALAGE